MNSKALISSRSSLLCELVKIFLKGKWILNEIWFSQSTAYRLMAFCKKCDHAGFLLEYHPKKETSSTVTVTVGGGE